MKNGTIWQTALSMLILRLFAAYEFLESGLQKWNGENWFSEINSQFPFPFNIFPDSLNWNLAMYAELLLPVLLLLGLATRLSALGLIIVTAVAWAVVHAGLGYNVCDNGYKMALIYIVVLIPLLLQGAGTWSLDQLIKHRFHAKCRLKNN